MMRFTKALKIIVPYLKSGLSTFPSTGISIFMMPSLFSRSAIAKPSGSFVIFSSFTSSPSFIFFIVILFLLASSDSFISYFKSRNSLPSSILYPANCALYPLRELRFRFLKLKSISKYDFMFELSKLPCSLVAPYSSTSPFMSAYATSPLLFEMA